MRTPRSVIALRSADDAARLVDCARAVVANEHAASTIAATNSLCMIEDTPTLALVAGAKEVPRTEGEKRIGRLGGDECTSLDRRAG